MEKIFDPVTFALAKGSGGGSGEPVFRYTTMPTASAANVGNIVQYIGNTTANYTNGYYYQCVENSGTYSWVQKNVQPGGGGSDLPISIVDGKLCVTYEEE